MNKYFYCSIFAFKSVQVYRLESFLKVFGSIIMIIAMQQVWSAIYHYGDEASLTKTASVTQMFTYTTVSVLIAKIYIFPMSIEISQKVSNGDIIFELFRPWNFLLMHFFRTLGFMFHTFVFTIIPSIIFVSIFLPIYIPKTNQIFWFIISMFLAIVIAFLIESFLGILAFQFTEIWGFDLIKDTLINVISGSFVPLWLFPDFLQKIIFFLPFKAMFYIPLSIFIGTMEGEELYFNILFQFVWIIILGISASLFLALVQRKLITFGG
ncbi:hypothetical protein COD67_07615 [Bacillus cereus]|nr:hypothetical protein COI89_08680 [Bacillus cereus]PGU68124.1 hypothetical protein COD67_07615 [Bacillus cereus]